MTEEAEAVSESTDSEEVISMSRESQSGRSDVTSLPTHKQSRQNLPPTGCSSLSVRPPGAEDSSDWIGVDCFGAFCSLGELAGFVLGELGAFINWFSGSGSWDGVAVVVSVLWLEIRDC